MRAESSSRAGFELPDLDGFVGIDPRWSRHVVTTDPDGTHRHWHVLDTAAGAEGTADAGDGRAAGGSPRGTLLCVHGNPTWSYLWRGLLGSAPPGWRVVAADHLGMGWSARDARVRTLADRIADLGALTDALGLAEPVVVVAHDWGGPISLGWALEHRAQVRAVVLTNTAVHHEPDLAGPALIRMARVAALRTLVCEASPLFVRATTALSRPALAPDVRRDFAAPYRGAVRRRGVADFVADIPFETDHPSRATLEKLAGGLSASLTDVPVLILWGTRDPVFAERYLRDLQARFPQADVHRYSRASHLVLEDAPEAIGHLWQWVADLADAGGGVETTTADGGPGAGRVGGDDDQSRAIGSALDARAADPAVAVVECGRDGAFVSFAELARRVAALAAGFAASGMRRGQRVALLVRPGIDLTAIVYACWRIGAVVVVADAGLGTRALGRALRGAAPDYVVGIPAGLALARAMRVPGEQILAGQVTRGERLVLRNPITVSELATLGRGRVLPDTPGDDDECAVLFTSGATGPAKGVVYRHGQVRAQLDLLTSAYGFTSDDRLVAAFAPFALYGPALGIGAAVPDMDVTAPGTLTAVALADAAASIDATVVFASPAALTNVVATLGDLTDRHRAALGRVRLATSAGAPVPVPLLRSVQALLPNAELHTPYGMTEALPVADVSLAELEAAGTGNGVCVGHPLAGVRVSVSPLDADGTAEDELTDQQGITGEVLVRARHVKDRYDRLWGTERAGSRNHGWHRTGDVGHLDDDGRLWVEGRLVHVITSSDGPVTPVAPELAIQTLDDVAHAAVVGVGPAGTQQVVAVVVPAVPAGRPRPAAQRRLRPTACVAPPALAHAVRAAAGIEVAAILVVDALPVDIRHASKIDRTRVAVWAARVLTGGRVPRL